MDRYADGVPSWVDLGTSDLPGARAFYGGLFDWSFGEGPPEAGGYVLAEIDGKPVAGLGPKMNPDMPTVWMTYVNVDDADAVAAKVPAAGGTMLAGPFDVMDVGRLGIFSDPLGAVLGIWQPRAHKGAALVNEPRTYCWSELVTTDTARSEAFYNAVFGWGAETETAEAMTYTEWQLGGRSVGGMMLKPPAIPAEVPPFWGVYFAVADTDATVAQVTELGGSVMMPPADIEPGRFAVVADPDGAMFQVLRLKEGLGG